MNELELIRRYEPDPTPPTPPSASRMQARAILDAVIALEISRRKVQLDSPSNREPRPPEHGHGIEL